MRRASVDERRKAVVKRGRAKSAANLPRDANPIGTATDLAREIHQVLKRGERTQDHGLIGNLKCILDHVCRDRDPEPL